MILRICCNHKGLEEMMRGSGLSDFNPTKKPFICY